MDYRLREVTSRYDLSVDEQKVDFLKEATELVARLPGSVERQVYAMRVAAMAAVPENVVAGEVERRRKRLLSSARKAEDRQQTRLDRAPPSGGKALRYTDPASAAAEEGLIRLLYLEPALSREPALPPPGEFSSPELGHIYGAMLEKLRRGETASTATLGEALSGEEMSLLVSLLQKPELLSRSGQSLRDYIAKIRERRDEAGQAADLRSLANKYREKKGYEG